jgi:hypothetical protein
VTDLISPDAAKILARCIPDLRVILGVHETEWDEVELESAEAVLRLKSLLGRILSTFTVRNMVYTSQTP